MIWDGLRRRIRFPIRDRDSTYGGPFDEVFRSEGIRIASTKMRVERERATVQPVPRCVDAVCSTQNDEVLSMRPSRPAPAALAGLAVLLFSTPAAALAGSLEKSGQAPAKTVIVREADYRITLSSQHFRPGVYRFVVVNKGGTTHALAISGPGIRRAETKTITSGTSTVLTVRLLRGNYRLYDPVDGHARLGMRLTIHVG